MSLVILVEMPSIIKVILARDTHAVRHPILRQGRPIEDCIFAGDHDPDTLHLGAFMEDKLVGVLSAYQRSHPDFKTEKSYQIRGVAVMTNHHRKGIGKELMSHIETLLIEREIDVIWLNARIGALAFYTSIAYTQIGTAFEIEKIGTHYCFYKKLK